MLWGLACGGEAGAREILNIMTREIDEMLAFTGNRLRYLFFKYK